MRMLQPGIGRLVVYGLLLLGFLSVCFLCLPGNYLSYKDYYASYAQNSLTKLTLLYEQVRNQTASERNQDDTTHPAEIDKWDDCGGFLNNRIRKPQWIFIVYIDSPSWEVVHLQYEHLLQQYKHTVDIQFKFIHGSLEYSIEIKDQLETYAEAELLFIFNEHDFLNIGSLMNLDTICQIYKHTESGILCIREERTSRAFTSADNYVNVPAFKPQTKIPKITLNRTWYNCGPEWANPIVLRPSIDLKRNATVTAITFAEDAYIRYDYRDTFAYSEKQLPPKYYLTSIPPSFSKSKDEISPPSLVTVPTGTCQNSSLTVLVKTALLNTERRTLVRTIHEVFENNMNMAVKIYFLLGKPVKPNDELTKEIEEFNDIVIGNFKDNYNNLPKKTFTGHHFFNSDFFDPCPENKWVIFHDDDAFVDYKKINDNLATSGYSNQNFICLYGNGMGERELPTRSASKWTLNIDQYSYGYKFPRFCNGPCAVISKTGSGKVLKQAKERVNPGVYLEDVLFTGIFRTLANITEIVTLPGACEHLVSVEKLEERANLLQKQFPKPPEMSPPNTLP